MTFIFTFLTMRIHWPYYCTVHVYNDIYIYLPNYEHSLTLLLCRVHVVYICEWTVISVQGFCCLYLWVEVNLCRFFVVYICEWKWIWAGFLLFISVSGSESVQGFCCLYLWVEVNLCRVFVVYICEWKWICAGFLLFISVSGSESGQGFCCLYLWVEVNLGRVFVVYICEWKWICAGFLLFISVSGSESGQGFCCLYLYCCWKLNYQEVRIGIPLTGLFQPHFYACPKPGAAYPMP